jgi:hypothetical protein
MTHAACCMQVVRLHDRSSALLAELEELKAARSSRGAALSDTARGADQGTGPHEAAARAAACAADKELMLKQIDSLKEVRPLSSCCQDDASTPCTGCSGLPS